MGLDNNVIMYWRNKSVVFFIIRVEGGGGEKAKYK